MSGISGFKASAERSNADGKVDAGEWANLAAEYAQFPRADRETLSAWLQTRAPRLQRLLGSGVLTAPAVRGPQALPDQAHLEALALRVVNNSFARVPPRAGESRHRLNQRLYQHDWTAAARGAAPPAGPPPAYRYDGSDMVVIAFEGTGAFEPRLAPAMDELARTLRAGGYDVSGLEAQSLVTNALSAVERRDARWSGLARGPHQLIVRNPELDDRIQWLSFPSEELEVLSAPDAFKDSSIPEFVREVSRSIDSEPQGIMSALDAMRSIAAQAHAQGKNPSFVVVTHSSGGRSAVKFLEHAKASGNPADGGAPYRFPLVFTIDPVREAHEALLEAAREVINKKTEHGANYLRVLARRPPRRVYPPTVGSEWQTSSLYQPSNADRHVNFFQKRDTEGLKMGPKFGIHGSPIHRTTENTELSASKHLGDAGHGEIAYHPAVLSRLKSELESVLGGP